MASVVSIFLPPTPQGRIPRLMAQLSAAELTNLRTHTSIVISQIMISIQLRSGVLPILHFTRHNPIQAWLCGFASPAAIAGQAENWQGFYLQVFMLCSR